MMKQEKKVIGWREWVCLPELGIKNIKAKIDTGARTSSLHAFDMKIKKTSHGEYVEFTVHPEQRNIKKTIKCKCKVVEYRSIKSSNGHSELRPVIISKLQILDEEFDIELTLTNRDTMGFRLLLGRECFRKKFLIDAGKSYFGKKMVKSKVKHIKGKK